MRDIKFRAVANASLTELDAAGIPYQGKFVYGSYSDGFILGPIIDVQDEYITHQWWVEIDKSTLEQYAGLKDVNGKPIYEGDIVELDNQGYDTDGVPAEKIYTGKIDWESGGFNFIASKSCDNCNAFPIQAATGDDLEVIGNIHQNPGLLEASHD